MAQLVIPNLINAGKVLKLLARHRQGKRPSEIAKALDIPRTTVIRILNSLAEENLVFQSGPLWELGPGLIGLGEVARSNIKIGEIARPVLAELSQTIGETVQLAVFNKDSSLILEVHKGNHPLSATTNPGSAVDLHCSATGKIFLAHMEPSARKELLEKLPLQKRTPNTLVDPESLVDELERIVRRGYSLDEQEYFSGVRCVGAPVFDHDNKVVAAVGITSSVMYFKEALTQSWAEEVIRAAGIISSRMGAR